MKSLILLLILIVTISSSIPQLRNTNGPIVGPMTIVPIEDMKQREQCEPAKPCAPGLILPVWQPQEGISWGTRIFRAFIYLIAMLYLFLGVSIVADRFMAAIEVITSQEREVKLKKPTGEPYVILVIIILKYVKNTGSSAPEILLSIIEIFGNNFEAGELGPSTIVGSAAFNFFLIIAICVMVIPNGEVRKIDRVDVFWITAIWATFAYIWLYLILCIISPNVVEVWEGVLTFLFFFATVISAYIANRFAPAFGMRILGPATTGFTSRSQAKASPRAVMTRYGDGRPKDEVKLEGATSDQADALLPPTDPAIAEFEEHKHHFWEVFQRLRAENPDLTIQELGKLAAFQALSAAPKSRAVRRLEAIRWLSGGFLFPRNARERTDEVVKPLLEVKQKRAIVSFSPCHYICMENIGTIKLTVACDRGALSEPTIVTAHYKTVEGSAKEHTDFVPVTGIVTFHPHEDKQEISIKIVDRPEYEHDEDFEVQLYHVKAVSATNPSLEYPSSVGAASSATVIIVDDDHGGAFSFPSEVFKIPENEILYRLKVNRTRGARGRITIPYNVIEGRAKQGTDFNVKSGELFFLDGQTSAEIPIEIINDNDYEKSEDFYIELGEPIWHTPAPSGEDGADGRPVLGEHKRCKIIIIEDQQFKHFVDKLIAKTNVSIMIGTSSWKQQFQEALNPTGFDETDKPNTVQKILHYISLPWKLIFACIPPTDYAHGWVCFFVAIVMIGVMTAIIGDVASHFGCTIGLKDSVTAISLVAVGTSVPDTFASKIAAVQDKTADSSIGNVTGSNAVNVFLGIGVAWSIAAIYHAWNGTVFRVQAGSLASSVALFLIGSVICIAILQFRRYNKAIGGELGGPAGFKWATSGIFFLIWLLYLVYCSLDAYCLLPNIGA